MSKQIPNSTASSLLSIDMVCRKTGVLLGVFQATIVEGSVPLLQSVGESVFYHPFFGLSDGVLLSKLDDAINTLINDDWEPRNQHNLTKLQILTAVVLDRLGCFVSRTPSIPEPKIAIASCVGLRSIARWFLTETSKRPLFPAYVPASHNAALSPGWSTFRGWLWSCFEIRAEYQTKIRRINEEAEARLRFEATREVTNSSVGYRKSDLKKIWNWLHVQLSEHIHSGRLETYKRIFLLADIEPELWNLDDIEDLQIDIAAYCDETANVYSFAIRRCRVLAEFIQDFYDAFKIVNYGDVGSSTELEKQCALELEKQLDEQLKEAQTLVEPQEANYSSRAMYLQARAKYNLLMAHKQSQEARQKDQS